MTVEPNWFSVDGDTKMGRRDVIIQLDPKIRSEAGFGALPFDIRKQYFDVHIEGTEKGSPQTSVILDLTLSPDGKPGTYIWHGTKPVIDVNIVFPGRLGYTSLDFGPGPRLRGSTTIMERDSNDSAGLVKGFYNGRVKWTEGVGRSAKDHYVTIRGHFAVPGVGAATKP